ncbi:hypothetical protein ES708_09743 [subsurface metagenome]
MKRPVITFTLIFLVINSYSQDKTPVKLPVAIEELTSPDFALAVEKSKRTCIIPLGILEKHGHHLPLATDLITAREIAIKAAQQEYTLVFPSYYFGQIFEAKHQPGTFAYSHELIWKLLEETCEELSRNGIKKIVLVNGHGGNDHFLPYFCQAQLAKKRDFAVVLFRFEENEEYTQRMDELKQTEVDGHAGELESSVMYSIQPDLVHTERAGDESGSDMARLDSLPNAYTGIWWYAKFPNHYAGDGSHVNAIIGELYLKEHVRQLTELLKFVKQDHTLLELQNEFFRKSQNPLGK